MKQKASIGIHNWFLTQVRQPVPKLAEWIFGLALASLSIYTAGFGLLDDVLQRTLMVSVSVVAVALAEPLAKRFPDLPAGGKILLWTVDLVIVAAMTLSIFWVFRLQDSLWEGVYEFTALDLFFAASGMVALLEITRRAMGLPLAMIGVLAIAYGLFGEYLPWILNHPSYSLEETLQAIWYSFDGVFGLPAAVVGGQIFVFFVFGAMLLGTGAGATLLKVSTTVTGRLRGGPAHAAIVSSALFGTISGSVTANVVGTGVFTIPMTKSRGFAAHFAGGVEAAASTGGQFMPPVMGAAAFLMAEMLGVSYLTVTFAALLPSMFYYGSLFVAVSVEAARKNLKPIPEAERPRLTREDWKQMLTFVIPVCVIVFTLIMGRSPAVVGLFGLLATVATGLIFNPELRRNPGQLIDSLAQGGMAGARIMVAVGTIGIVVGVLSFTGLGIEFAMTVMSLGGDSLIISLILTMFACLVLGMGLPTLPAYLIIVLIMGPALQQLAVPPLTTHLFVLYFGVLSAITPPVAVAAFAAAPIAGSHPLRTAVTAMRLAAVGFIIPFVFVYHPSLLLGEEFQLWPLLWIALRLVLAIWLLTTGLAGYDKTKLSYLGRGVRVAIGVLVLVPEPWVAVITFVFGTVLVSVARHPSGSTLFERAVKARLGGTRA